MAQPTESGGKHIEKAEKTEKNSDKFSNSGYNNNEVGAVYHKNDKEKNPLLIGEDKRQYDFAVSYYNAVMNRPWEHEVKAIYKNICEINNMKDFTINDVERAYKHVFVNKHELSKGYTYFDPDVDMAHSWQRLREGKSIKPHDLTMLRHECLESKYMDIDKLPYEEVHNKTNIRYNYQEQAKKYNEERGKKGEKDVNI